MEKYIPYEKLSKKRKREINAQKRGSWGGLNPVTRKPEHSKAYRRSKAGQWKKEYPGLPCFFIAPAHGCSAEMGGIMFQRAL